MLTRVTVTNSVLWCYVVFECIDHLMDHTARVLEGREKQFIGKKRDHQ